MTNHIEELMKVVEVSKYKLFRQYNYARVPHGKEELQKSKDLGIECVDVRNCKDGDNDCIYWSELHYPAFTPSKQLELIKLIMKAGDIDNIHQYYYEISKMFVFECRSLPELGTYNQWSTQNVNYELALAELVLILINENKLDKSEVKKILED